MNVSQYDAAIEGVVVRGPRDPAVLREHSAADDGGIENTVFGLSERKIW